MGRRRAVAVDVIMCMDVNPLRPTGSDKPACIIMGFWPGHQIGLQVADLRNVII